MKRRGPGSEALLISTAEDVIRLRSSPARLWAINGPIALRLPGLAPAEQDRVESRLNELAAVCGCAEGSAAGAIALVAVAVVWLVRDAGFSLASLATAAGVVIGVAVLAKLLRVTLARVQLRRLLDALLPAATARPGRRERDRALP